MLVNYCFKSVPEMSQKCPSQESKSEPIISKKNGKIVLGPPSWLQASQNHTKLTFCMFLEALTWFLEAGLANSIQKDVCLRSSQPEISEFVKPGSWKIPREPKHAK